MSKETLHIDGMSCVSCERKIVKELEKTKGIYSIEADYVSSTVKVEFNKEITKEEIVRTIENLDYKVITDEKKKSYMVIGIIIIILAVYLVINSTIGFNIIPVANQSMGYGMLFIVGLITSLHCVAMCGGINLSQSLSTDTEEKTNWQRIKPTLFYNLGRVVAYTVVGAIVGTLGQLISFTGMMKGIISIAAGVFMLIMGINMLNLFPKLRKINLKMPSIVLKTVSSFKRKSTPFYIGLLNGLMPCGPLQSMQIYALGTGNTLEGAVSMFFFSLGTVPLMLGIGVFSTYLSKKFSRQMIKAGAILVVVLGVVMLNRGLNLSGVATKIFAFGGPENIAVVDGNKQIVRSKIESGRYPTITVKKGIPVEWKISAKDKDLNGCNNPITLPKFNIEKELEVGENIINFTPEKEGKFVYTCWMGMISGTIIVE